MYTPIACLPIADWYVLRGDWLWSGKGMIDAQMPRIIDGWISQCVYWYMVLSGRKSESDMAIMHVSSSSVSMYSIKPPAMHLDQSNSVSSLFWSW